jgi:hypothetical protein
MATNRAMLKEAIADAKAVKETAIANAKAALEEAFTPQLKSMLSMKLQEMDLEEDNLEETYMYEEDENSRKTYEKGTMEEVDLEELLAELEEDELEEGLYEAEETEEETEETEETEEETEDEAEPIDLEDMTDEDLKSMIEDVIADMIKSGELEAGSESEEEEIEPEEVEVEDEEDVDLAELLREIEEMEGGYGLEEEETITPEQEENALKQIFEEELVSEGTEERDAEVTRILSKLKGLTPEQLKDEDLVQKTLGNDDVNKVMNDGKFGKFKRFLKNLVRKTSTPLILFGLAAFAKGSAMTSTTGLKADDLQDPNFLVKIGLGVTLAAVIAKLASIPNPTPKQESMHDELKEAYSTIETLKSELNEINLLNAKLLYTNKIFKSKTLNESQKVKVLSSFDKAKNVGEVKMVFETLNEGIKVSKNTINENLGRASKGTITPNVKKPIVESNEAFLRMQKLAGII